jgi:hypothetical protein
MFIITIRSAIQLKKGCIKNVAIKNTTNLDFIPREFFRIRIYQILIICW